MPDGFEKQLTAGRADRPAGVPDARRASTCRCRSTRPPRSSARRGMFYSEESHGRAADLPRLEAARRSRACRSVLVDPQGDKRAERDPAVRPARARCRRRCRKSVDAAVQHAGEGDPPAERRQRLGRIPYSEKGSVSHDRPPALRRRQDRGPRAEERRALRRLHPPRGRAGLEVRLRRCAASRSAT